MASIRDKMEEECGIFAIYSSVPQDTYNITKFGLTALQHRGQESAGIASSVHGKIHLKKGKGLVSDVFNKPIWMTYQGEMSIGHVRYSTTGTALKKYNYQPLYERDENDETLFSVAHNGNLINSKTLKKELEKEGFKFRTSSDSEVILKLMLKYKQLPKLEMIKQVCLKIQGAYSLLILFPDSLLAVRDVRGFRPLCLGKLEDGTQILSSETCGLDAVGAKFVRDIQAGEILYLHKNKSQSYQIESKVSKQLCSFEYIYFSRPDSFLDGKNVHEIREKLGVLLWHQHPVEADVVLGVPDSGIPSAIGISKASGLPLQFSLIKNRYMGRSFIEPLQKKREDIVKLKLNPIVAQIKGKKIVVVDDSVVRGTTSKRIIEILRKAGAKEIHFRISSPPVVSPCFFGIDTPKAQNLIAHTHSLEQIREILDVDTLEFLSIKNLQSLLKAQSYCSACFTGKYQFNSLNKLLFH